MSFVNLQNWHSVSWSVQSSSVPWPIGSSERHFGIFGLFCRTLLWADLSLGGDVHSLMFPMKTFPLPTTASPTLQGTFQDVFLRSCRGVWHVRTMQVPSLDSCQKGVPVDPQGSWSCSAPNRWSCALSRRCREVSWGTWFRKPGSFFKSLQAGSMFHRPRGGWRWQETCRAWTCLRSWWCCTARSVSSSHCCHCWGNLDADFCWAGGILAQGCSQVLETGHLLWLLAAHTNIFTAVVLAVGHDLALFCADFHSILRCSVYRSVGEFLKITSDSAHKINIDVVGKP